MLPRHSSLLLAFLLLPLLAAPGEADAVCRYFHCVCGDDQSLTWHPPETLVEGSVLEVQDGTAYVVVEAVHAAPEDGPEVGYVLTASARNGAIRDGDYVLMHGGRAYLVTDDDVLTCGGEPMPVTREHAVTALLGSNCPWDLEVLYPDAQMTPPCNDTGGCSAVGASGVGTALPLLGAALAWRRRRRRSR